MKAKTYPKHFGHGAVYLMAALITVFSVYAQEEEALENWGLSADGFRLSVAFPKDTYVIGEPIVAVTVLRNISKETARTYSWGSDADFQVFAINSEGKRMRIINPSFGHGVSGMPSSLVLASGDQFKAELRIDTFVDLSTPGPYTIYLKREVANANKTAFVLATSGNASIRIIAPPGASGKNSDYQSVQATANAVHGTPKAEPALAKVSSPNAATKQNSTAVVSKKSSSPSSADSLPSSPTASNANLATHSATSSSSTETGLTPRDKTFGSVVLFLLAATALWLFVIRRRA